MSESKWEDNVIRPPHYLSNEVECIDAIRGMLGPEGFDDYCKGQVLKYIWRAGLKGDRITDLQKAKFYLLFALGEDPRGDRENT